MVKYVYAVSSNVYCPNDKIEAVFSRKKDAVKYAKDCRKHYPNLGCRLKVSISKYPFDPSPWLFTMVAMRRDLTVTKMRVVVRTFGVRIAIYASEDELQVDIPTENEIEAIQKATDIAKKILSTNAWGNHNRLQEIIAEDHP